MANYPPPAGVFDTQIAPEVGCDEMKSQDADAKRLEYDRMRHEQLMISSVQCLKEARRIRSDEALMGDIKAWLRAKKREFNDLIDEIGG